MVPNNSICFMTIGRRLSGKTTVAKYLGKELGARYLSEAEIKKQITSRYTPSAFLNDEMQSMAYKLAIARAVIVLSEGKSVIVDASFDKQENRTWLYEQIYPLTKVVVRLYCLCPNIETIGKRVSRIKKHPGPIEFFKDTMDAYHQMDQNFEEPDIDTVPDDVFSPIFYINTYSNELEKVDVGEKNRGEYYELIRDLTATIQDYLAKKKGGKQ